MNLDDHDAKATIPTGVRPTPHLPPLERQLLVWLRAPAPGEALNAAVYADAMVGLLKRGLARLTGTLQACSLQLTPAGLATAEALAGKPAAPAPACTCGAPGNCPRHPHRRHPGRFPREGTVPTVQNPFGYTPEDRAEEGEEDA